MIWGGPGTSTHPFGGKVGFASRAAGEDIAVSYERFGTGEPLLVLLPSSAGPRGTTELLRRFGDYRDVVCVHPGQTARSEAVSAAHLLASLADEVVDLIDALELGPVDLVCHSTGCGIGQSLASRYQARVRRLILVAPWTHADPHLHGMQTLRIAAARTFDPEQYSRFNAALLFPPEYRRAHEAGFAQMARAAVDAPQDADAIACRLQAILAFDARVVWRDIASPTLVVTARDDQLMPSWQARETAAGIPGAELVELDGGGHMLLETRFDTLADLISGFLLRAGPSGAA